MQQLRCVPLLTAVVVLWSGATVSAHDPLLSCEASKLKTAGKYDLCRLKAEAKAVKTFSTPDFGKCDAKFSNKWGAAEARAMGQCPSTGDAAAIETFITQHTDDLAAALAGGPLPDCPGDLATCTGDLATCNGSLGTCPSDLATCTGDLGTCGSSLTTCNSRLSSCNSTLTSCANELVSCMVSLHMVDFDTAVPTDVLAGKTFSSSSGLGLTGTMANNGAVSITPGTTPQSIAAGYHSGSGTVAGDADLIAANITDGVNIFGVTGTALPAQRLKTGQTTCYDIAGSLIGCTATGQDGELQKGLARGAYIDNGDGTITDVRTGLMWEKLADDGSIHDWNATYSWGDALSVFIPTLNGGAGFAGHTDWRLPNRGELESLADLGRMNPAIDPIFHTGCVPGCTVLTCSCTSIFLHYWTSTTNFWSTTTAWLVYFTDGDVNAFPKDWLYHVRAVRGGS